VIPLPLWIGSFVYLSLVCGFVCTAVKEDDDRELFKKTLGFLGMIAGGTLGFCAVILIVERVL
jgi:hypothetical protein